MTAKLSPAEKVFHKPPSEKVVQRYVTDFWARLGFEVHATSQYRRSGMQLGLPDLIVEHLAAPTVFWWETKKPRRKHSSGALYDHYRPATWEPEPLAPAQVAFRERRLAAGQLHGWGGIQDAYRFAADALELGDVEQYVFRANRRCQELVRRVLLARQPMSSVR